MSPSHILNSNSRYLPPPIRTYYSVPALNDHERAASFLNQDWHSPTSTRLPTPSSDPYRLSTRAVFPQHPHSKHSPPGDYGDDSDDSDNEYHAVRRERIPPRLSLSAPTTPLVEARNSHAGALARQHDLSYRRNSVPSRRAPRRVPWDRATPSTGRASHIRATLESRRPSSMSPRLPPIGILDVDVNPHKSQYSSATPTPPPHTPSPLLPTKSEPSPAPSIPYSNHIPDVDAHIQKTGSSKSMCVWRMDSGVICGFESSASLVKRHIRTVHLKIRPVTCPVCHQGFSTKFHLKTHENIHTGLKPYSCPDCSKTFSNPSSRHHHRVRYHGYVQTWRHYGDKNKKR